MVVLLIVIFGNHIQIVNKILAISYVFISEHDMLCTESERLLNCQNAQIIGWSHVMHTKKDISILTNITEYCNIKKIAELCHTIGGVRALQNNDNKKQTPVKTARVRKSRMQWLLYQRCVGVFPKHGTVQYSTAWTEPCLKVTVKRIKF